MHRARFLLACVALLLVASLSFGAVATNTVKLGTLPEITLTVDATSAAVSEVDVGTSSSKRAARIAAVVSGQAVVILLRFEKATNGIFVDAVVSDTTGNLATAVAAMDLSTAVPSHPTPAADAIDTATAQ